MNSSEVSIHGFHDFWVAVDADVDPRLRQSLPMQVCRDALQPVVVCAVVSQRIPELAQSRVIVTQKVIHKVATCRGVRILFGAELARSKQAHGVLHAGPRDQRASDRSLREGFDLGHIRLFQVEAVNQQAVGKRVGLLGLQALIEGQTKLVNVKEVMWWLLDLTLDDLLEVTGGVTDVTRRPHQWLEAVTPSSSTCDAIQVVSRWTAVRLGLVMGATMSLFGLQNPFPLIAVYMCCIATVIYLFHVRDDTFRVSDHCEDRWEKLLDDFSPAWRLQYDELRQGAWWKRCVDMLQPRPRFAVCVDDEESECSSGITAALVVSITEPWVPMAEMYFIESRGSDAPADAVWVGRAANVGGEDAPLATTPNNDNCEGVANATPAESTIATTTNSGSPFVVTKEDFERARLQWALSGGATDGENASRFQFQIQIPSLLWATRYDVRVGVIEGGGKVEDSIVTRCGVSTGPTFVVEPASDSTEAGNQQVLVVTLVTGKAAHADFEVSYRIGTGWRNLVGTGSGMTPFESDGTATIPVQPETVYSIRIWCKSTKCYTHDIVFTSGKSQEVETIPSQVQPQQASAKTMPSFDAEPLSATEIEITLLLDPPAVTPADGAAEKDASDDVAAGSNGEREYVCYYRVSSLWGRTFGGATSTPFDAAGKCMLTNLMPATQYAVSIAPAKGGWRDASSERIIETFAARVVAAEEESAASSGSAVVAAEEPDVKAASEDSSGGGGGWFSQWPSFGSSNATIAPNLVESPSIAGGPANLSAVSGKGFATPSTTIPSKSRSSKPKTSSPLAFPHVAETSTPTRSTPAASVEGSSRVAELAGWARAATGGFNRDKLSSFVGWSRTGSVPPGTPAGVIPATPMRETELSTTEDPPTTPNSPFSPFSPGSDSGTPASAVGDRSRFIMGGASPAADDGRSSAFLWQQQPRPGSSGIGAGVGINGKLHSLYQGHLSPLLRISRSGTPVTPADGIHTPPPSTINLTPLRGVAEGSVRTPLTGLKERNRGTPLVSGVSAGNTRVPSSGSADASTPLKVPQPSVE